MHVTLTSRWIYECIYAVVYVVFVLKGMIVCMHGIDCIHQVLFQMTCVDFEQCCQFGLMVGFLN